MAGLNRKKDYGSKKKPYPNVKSKDFAGGNRSYPIPTKADAIDALRLAGLHGRSDVKSKVYRKYPGLKKKEDGGWFDDMLSGAVEGGTLGSQIYPGWGTAIGAVLGGVVGGIGGYNAEEAVKSKEYLQKVNEIYHPAVSKGRQVYDTSLAENGMNLKKLTHRTDYKGASHKNGGITIPIKDTAIEVEDKESRTGNTVHSFKNKITKPIFLAYGGKVPIKKSDIGKSISDVLRNRDNRFTKRSGDEWNDVVRKVTQIPFEEMSNELSEVSQNLERGGKIKKVMKEFKKGTLRSGSKKGPIVKDRDQAIAIAISEAEKEGNYKKAEEGFNINSLFSNDNLSSLLSSVGMFESLLSKPETVNYSPAKFTRTAYTPISSEGGINKIKRVFGNTRNQLQRVGRNRINDLIRLSGEEASAIGDYSANIASTNAMSLQNANNIDAQNANRVNLLNANINMQSKQDTAANIAQRENLISSYAANTATIAGQKSADEKRMKAQDEARKNYLDILKGYQDIWKDNAGNSKDVVIPTQPQRYGEIIGDPSLQTMNEYFGIEDEDKVFYDEEGYPIKKEFGGSIIPKTTELLKRRYRTY